MQLFIECKRGSLEYALRKREGLLMSARRVTKSDVQRLRVSSWGIFGLMAVLCSATLVLAQNASSVQQHGFDDFSRGQLGNSGANLYVSRDGRIQVINKWDLNRDGYPDLLMSNDHDVYEAVDSLIYWGGAKGYTSILPDLWKEMPLAQVLFDVADHAGHITRLPSFGGGKSAIADLNRDGYPDIIFCNYIHNYPGVRTAYIYWGSADGYSVSHRTELPTNWADGVAAADLNGDGYPDLIFANQGTEPGSESTSPITSNDSFIYWGSATGFSPDRRTSLATKGARDVTVADLNHDGHPDIIFVNDNAQTQDVQIYWGSASGFSNENVQTIPVPEPTSVHSADVNGDGYPDLIITTAGNPLKIVGTAQNERAASGQPATYIFLGSVKGFDSQRVVRLPGYQGEDSCVGDFNHDGFPDIAVAHSSDGQTSVVPSYVYWGSENGFSADRRTELPTLGARGVVCADLNQDGYADLVFANSDDGKTHDVPSYIYWGSPSGFAPYLRTDLQGFGAASVNVADLNGDGYPDLLLVNRYSGTVIMKGGVNSHIFWGNPHHFYSTASMTSLPSLGAYGTCVADLNDDGYPDVVLTSTISNQAYIYWGNRAGFSVDHRTSLSVGPTYQVHAADLNHDGFLDLVFSGVVNGKQIVTILWGSATGYSEQNEQVLHLSSDKLSASLFFQIADLNRDGNLDLIVHGYSGELQIFWGSVAGYSESKSWTGTTPYGGDITLADLDGDGYLDFILSGAFDPEKRSNNAKTMILRGTSAGTPSQDGAIELEAYASEQCAVADLNRDGYLDIVCSNYMSDSTRSLPIFIFWGSKDGHYSNANRTDLPAESSLGLQLIDLDGDGYPDIVVHNHLNGTRHTNNSYIYWNSPKGFDLSRRSDLPNFGPHLSQMIDPGNLYTRKLEEQYVSSPIEIPHEKAPSKFKWQGEERSGTKLKFQIRSASNRAGLEKSTWTGPDGKDSFYLTSGADLKMLPREDRWLQYRALFDSPNGGDWPMLSDVEIMMGDSR